MNVECTSSFYKKTIIAEAERRQKEATYFFTDTDD